jgi:hypothetical protein
MSETPTPGEFDLLEKLALSLLAHPGNPNASKPRPTPVEEQPNLLPPAR